jgi:hypothetical protein
MRLSMRMAASIRRWPAPAVLLFSGWSAVVHTPGGLQTALHLAAEFGWTMVVTALASGTPRARPGDNAPLGEAGAGAGAGAQAGIRVWRAVFFNFNMVLGVI